MTQASTPTGTAATITVRYFGIFSQYTGCTAEEVDLGPGTTVERLEADLCQRHGEEFTKAFQADLDYRSAIVAVNGDVAAGTTVLEPGDEVIISYPAGGG